MNKTPRKAVLNQVLQYLLDSERWGIYYGNKKQFDNRHLEAKKWIEDLINEQQNEQD